MGYKPRTLSAYFNLMTPRSPRIGIGGPVGSGKTMLCLKLCQKLRERYSMAVVTNDIYCSEDAQFLIRQSALPPGRLNLLKNLRQQQSALVCRLKKQREI